MVKVKEETPNKEYATKQYVDTVTDNKITHAFGIIKEYFDDKFQIIKESIDMSRNSQERFEFETQQNFKQINDHLYTHDIELSSIKDEQKITNNRLGNLKSEQRITNEKIGNLEKYQEKTDKRLENIEINLN